MHDSTQPVDRFFQALDDLLTVAARETALLTELEHSLSPLQCPARPSIVRILHSTHRLTQTFGEFLLALEQIFRDKALMQAVTDYPIKPADVRQLPGQLLTPYQIVNGLVNRQDNARFIASYLWNQTHDLLIWYAYLGCSMSAQSSLISKLNWFLMLTTTIQPLTWEQYCAVICPMLKPVHIRGVLHIARRATFLADATDRQIQASRLEWWSQQLDSVSRGPEEVYTLQGLLRTCPASTHPNAIELLQELVIDAEVPEEVCQQAQSVLAAQGKLK